MTESTPAPRFNPWNELAGVCVALLEAAWVALIFQALNEQAAAAATAWVLGYFALVFYAGFLLIRGFQAARLAQGPARVVLLAVFALLTWLGTRLVLTGGATDFDPLTTTLRGIGDITQLVPAWFWLGAALLWLFLRGSAAGREGVGLFAVQRHFKLGIVMFLVFSLLALTAARDLPGLGVFVVFLAATLLGMASARVALLGRLRGGRRSPFSRSWFWNLAAAVAATLTVGLSIAMLFTGRFALFYRQLLANIILGIITLTLAPFLFILGLFADTPIEALPAPPPTPALPPWEDGGDLLLEFAESDGGELVPPDFRIYYYIGLAAAGLVALVLIWRMQTAARRRGEVEWTEQIYERGDLLRELREAFAARRKQLADALSGGAALRRDQQIEAAARIRQIYIELIRLAERFGMPRDPAATPLEFSGRLAVELPSAGPDLDRVTSAYLKIRYGGFPERMDEVRAVEDSWNTIRTAGLERVRVHEKNMREAERERKRKESQA